MTWGDLIDLIISLVIIQLRTHLFLEVILGGIDLVLKTLAGVVSRMSLGGFWSLGWTLAPLLVYLVNIL
jgi:hypothetical protein